jgi:hypothetical protein
MAWIDDDHVRQLAGEHGVPGRVAEEAVGRMRPCVHLVPYEYLSRKEGATPTGRTGGLPALPAGAEWPDGGEPLALTIDCAALPRDALDFELPADGQLLFFTELKYEPEHSAVLHVPAGVPTTPHPARHVMGGETYEIDVHEVCELYPVAGLTVDEDWLSGPETREFLDGVKRGQDRIDHFKDAIRGSVFGEAECETSFIQLGGYPTMDELPPYGDEFILLAQIQGQGIDERLIPVNVILGTRDDIAARRFEKLQYEQLY